MTYAREEFPQAETEQYGDTHEPAPTHPETRSSLDFAELRRQGLAGVDPAAHSRHAVFRKEVGSCLKPLSDLRILQSPTHCHRRRLAPLRELCWVDANASLACRGKKGRAR